MNYSKFTVTEKGLEFKKEIILNSQGSEQEISSPKSQNSPKPMFLIKKAPASKLLLLKDGHNRFNDFNCNDITKLSLSLKLQRLKSLKFKEPIQEKPQYIRNTTKRLTQVYIDSNNSIQKMDSQFEIQNNLQNNKRIYEQFVTTNLMNANQLTTQRCLQQVLNLPSQRQTQKKRNEYKFQNYKFMHLDSTKSMEKLVSGKMVGIQENKEQSLHLMIQFLGAMKQEDQELEQLQNLVSSHHKRRSERIKTLHRKTYTTSWDQMNFPGDLRSENSSQQKLHCGSSLWSPNQ